MRRLLPSWFSFRPERAARSALVCGLLTCIALLLFLACAWATAVGKESVVDSLFPYLVLCAPLAAVCVPLSLVLGAFALISSRCIRMSRRHLRFAYFALVVALLTWLILGATWRQPVPSRPVPRSLELRRQFYAAQKARESIREVNWKNLRLFPPPQLSPQAIAKLREVKARYEGLPDMQTGDTQRDYMQSMQAVRFALMSESVMDRDELVSSRSSRFYEPSLRYWLGCVNALLGNEAEAMRNFTQPSRAFTPPGARSVRDLWAEMSQSLAGKASPCEVALVTGNREHPHLINTDPLADAFFARGQWREAAWRYERRLQVIYWRYRWMQPQIRYTPIPERVAQSYEKWVEEVKSPSQQRTLWERAAKANIVAARYETERAGAFHLRAAECWLRAGYPWRALVAYEHAKKDKSLRAQAERERQKTEAALAKADPTFTPSRIAERLKQFMAATKPFNEAQRYYMAFAPDAAIKMLRQFIQECPDPNDPLIDDALWHIGECRQSGVRYERVKRTYAQWVMVKGKRQRRVMTYYTNEPRRRDPQSALPELRELLQRCQDGDRAPEALASIAQIHYYPHKPIEETRAYLTLLRQHPDAPVAPKVLTLLWKALYNLQSGYNRPERVLARLHLTNDEEQEAVNAVLRFHVEFYTFGGDFEATSQGLRQIDLTKPNRLLRALSDVSLGVTLKPLPSAPFACGKAYYLRGDWKNAEKQFRKVLAHPDVYSYRGWARYRLARCLENQGDWLGALRELAHVEFLEGNTPLELSSPTSAARWRVNFILDTKLNRAQLEKHETDIRRCGLSQQWEMAMIARDLRDERLRDAVRRIEEFVVKYPHHPQTRALFDRLCQMERHLIPTVENGETAKRRNGESNAVASLIVRWTQRLLRAQSQFKRRMRLDLSQRHPMDDVLFAARFSPQRFRAQRVPHRLVNRLSWHVRVWNAYGGAPNAERLEFDHAFYYATHPLALKNYSGIGFKADVVFLERWGTTFDPWDNPDYRWKPQDARIAQRDLDHANSRLRAGAMFDTFVSRHPQSSLLPRALLMALQSHERYFASARQAAIEGLNLPHSAWQPRFQQVKQHFALLRAGYHGSKEERLAATLRCRCEEMKKSLQLSSVTIVPPS